MKKQFLFAIIIVIAAVCLSPLNNNRLIACDTNAASACSGVMIETKAIKIPAVVTEDTEISFDMFMNPFTHL